MELIYVTHPSDLGVWAESADSVPTFGVAVHRYPAHQAPDRERGAKAGPALPAQDYPSGKTEV